MGAQLSGGGGSRYSVQQNSEINVTPFVDVMLVLLIIFMVAAPLATVSVKVNLPTAVAKPTPSPPKPVTLSIKKDGSIYVQNSPSSLESIGDDLHKQLGKHDPAHTRIYIRCDQDTLYGDFLSLMNKLQDNGYYSVALTGADNSKRG